MQTIKSKKSAKTPPKSIFDFNQNGPCFFDFFPEKRSLLLPRKNAIKIEKWPVVLTTFPQI